MGQKVNPHGLRVGIIKDWDSNWYADKRNDEFAKNLAEDQILRKYLKTTLYKSNISKIEIERSAKNVKIVLYTAKPGVVIGKGGAGIEKIKADAQNIAAQLENRIAFRKAMKSCMGRTMKSGAQGIKCACSGRLGGADMARTEFYSEGTIPLQTLRADIDYGFAEADTTYGKVGVKTWIYHGEVLPTKTVKEGGNK